jgi:hypothetical protein
MPGLLDGRLDVRRRPAEQRVRVRGDAGREPFGPEVLGPCPVPHRGPRCRLEPLDGVADGVRRLLGEEQAGLAVDDGLRRTGPVERNHRRARGHRLDRRDAEVLLAGEDERPAALHQVGDHVVSLCAEELDGRAGHLVQARLTRSLAHHLERPTEPAACADGEVEPLVVEQPADNQVEVLSLPLRTEPVDDDGRIDDRGLPLVQGLDALRRGA